MRGRWLKIALVLVVLAIVFYLINLVVYVPRVSAFHDATVSWAEEHNKGAPPNPMAYGIDSTSIIIMGVLGLASSVMLLIGGSYMVIWLIERIARQLGYLSKK